MFHTAGKSSPIHVSKESLHRASKVLAENEVTDAPESISLRTQSKPAAVFQTAGKNLTIEVSEDSLRKVNQMFDDNISAQNIGLSKVLDSDNAMYTPKSNQSNLSSKSKPIAMFRTAGKSSPIHVSKESLQRGNEIISKVAVTNAKKLINEHIDVIALQKKSFLLQRDSNFDGLVKSMPTNESYIVNNIVRMTELTMKKGLNSLTSSPCATGIGFKSIHNPYRKKKMVHKRTKFCTKEQFEKSPADPISLMHISGTFRGKPISPSSLAKADLILSGRSNGIESFIPSLQSSFKQNVINVSEFSACDNFGVDTIEKTIKSYGKISLSLFDSVYGPFERAQSAQNTLIPCLHGISSSNALMLRFNSNNGSPSHFVGMECSSCDNKSCVGATRDLHDALVLRGCDDKLISDKWINNHYRWIVWKLASMERRYPSALGGRYLTYHRVVSQLLFRYHAEIRQAKRPAIRKILNRDIASNRPIVLCVSQILKQITTPLNGFDSENYWIADNKDKFTLHNLPQRSFTVRLELTDGWYSVPAKLDSNLTSFVENGKIRVGSKLLCNPQLVGIESGIDPLDVNYCSARKDCPVTLNLFANTTRLAKWDAKLGFVNPSAFRQGNGSFAIKSFADVIPGGGPLPIVDVIVCRCYARLYYRKHVTQSQSLLISGGNSNFLTEAEEDRARKQNEVARQRAIEKFVESKEKEICKVRHHTCFIVYSALLSTMYLIIIILI